MICILFIFATMVGYHFDIRIRQWQRMYSHEKHYYHNYNHAYSSLLWGQKRSWPTPNRKWQCQQDKNNDFIACIKQSTQANKVILKGGCQQISLYWIGVQNSSGSYDYLPGYWLDYYPEKYVSGYD